MFYAASTDQDSIASKVNLFIACAPVTRMNGTSKSLKLASNELPTVKLALSMLSIHEVFDNKDREKL